MKKLGIKEVKSIRIALQMANKSVRHAHGVVENIDSGPEIGSEKRCFVADSSEPVSREPYQILLKRKEFGVAIVGLRAEQRDRITCRILKSTRPWVEIPCVPMVTTDPSLDGLSLKGN
ncbi:hypothetical protein PIB30_065221 [Stylosanthes scabra]|uniref:Uncharacterized protein n=1 Tax=Stylosanthes scabra TaxID=79078 RepID=A0ABU6VNR9_9FABA|nr:hypothetical protein [Stylosanthes scabra]